MVPRVLSDFLNGDSLLWICYEDLRNEVSAAFRDEPRQSVVCAQDLLVEIRRFLVLQTSHQIKHYFEGQISTEHCVEHDPAAPKVRLESVILLASDHLQKVI